MLRLAPCDDPETETGAECAPFGSRPVPGTPRWVGTPWSSDPAAQRCWLHGRVKRDSGMTCQSLPFVLLAPPRMAWWCSADCYSLRILDPTVGFHEEQTFGPAGARTVSAFATRAAAIFTPGTALAESACTHHRHLTDGWVSSRSRAIDTSLPRDPNNSRHIRPDSIRCMTASLPQGAGKSVCPRGRRLVEGPGGYLGTRML